MTPLIATDRNANLQGSAWMVVAMAAFAVEDALIKTASVSVPLGQVLVCFGGVGALVFAAITVSKGEALFVPDVLSPVMGVRMGFEIFGRLFYALAIALIPLSQATVILQATPLVVVLGAAIFFRESVGWRRCLAIATGLAGVLVILQPGPEGWSWLSLLAVGGMLGFAGRDLASRAAPATLSATLLGVYGFSAIVVGGVAYAIWEGTPFVWPSLPAMTALLAASLIGVGAYTALMKAMRTGEVSAVTPFRYTRLVFGVVIGVMVFGEALTTAMIVGSAMIVLSGLFILQRVKPSSH